jgi:hypothetical protein
LNEDFFSFSARVAMRAVIYDDHETSYVNVSPTLNETGCFVRVEGLGAVRFGVGREVGGAVNSWSA